LTIDQKQFSNAANINISAESSLENLENIRPEWERLAALSCNPLISYDWFVSCMTSLCPSDKLKIFVLRSNGGTKGIAPLYYTERFGSVQFEIAGTKELMEPTAIISQDDASFEKMFEAILEQNHSLKRLPQSFLQRDY
jgi:hypothetical protein